MKNMLSRKYFPGNHEELNKPVKYNLKRTYIGHYNDVNNRQTTALQEQLLINISLYHSLITFSCH